MLRQLVVVLALTSAALAAISIADLEPKPDKFKDVEGCYLEDLDDVIPLGSSAPSKHSCKEYRCGATNVQVVECGASVAEPPCILQEDHTLPFPDCCPRIACPL